MSACRLLAVALLISLVASFANSQTTVCTTPPTCSANNVAVPPAWYNLTFSVNPATLNGNYSYPTNGNVSWEATEAGDAACTFQHQGITVYNVGNKNYIDMQAASGPASVGQVLPGIVGGPGSGSIAQGTAGWSFEVTARIGTLAGNNKIFTLGNGAAVNDIFMGADGTPTNINFGIYDSSGGYYFEDNFIQNIVTPPTINAWYHLVVVVQEVSDVLSKPDRQEHGAQFYYVNGQLLNVTYQDNFLVAAMRRNFTYIGSSQVPYWNDPYWTGLVDTFRIYDRALTAAQVQSLYQSEMAGCPLSISSNPAIPDPVPNVVHPTGTTIPAPFFSLNFSTNPLTTVNGASGYGWSQNAPSDAGNATAQALHQGVIIFNGTLNQFINLSTTTGANSVGAALPVVGGGTSGWSFEFVVKLGAQAQWAKIMDIGSLRSSANTCNNDIVFGWHSNDAGYWQFDVCDSDGVEHQTPDAVGVIQPGIWYHFVGVFTSPSSNGNGAYLVYNNGQLYTALANVYLPIAATRPNAYLGKSGWADSYITAELDTFNVYNQALSDVQVNNMYRAAILGLAPVSPVSGSSSSAAPAPASSSSALASSSSSIPAAINTTPVFACGGAGYNLASISTTDLVYIDSSYTWTLNPCRALTSGACVGKNASFCQGSTAVTYFNPAIDVVQWSTISNGIQSYSVSGDGCGNSIGERAGTVQYVCNATANTAFISSITESPSPNFCQYTAVVQTSAVCGTALTPISAVGLPYQSPICGGGLYNLSALDSTDFTFSTSGSNYWFRPCSGVSNPNCTHSSFCQGAGGSFYSLANISNSIVPDTYTLQSNGLLIQQQGGTPCGSGFNREANIYLICSPSATTPQLVSFGEAPGGTAGQGSNGLNYCHYSLALQTNTVCSLITPPSISSSSAAPAIRSSSSSAAASSTSPIVISSSSSSASVVVTPSSSSSATVLRSSSTAPVSISSSPSSTVVLSSASVVTHSSSTASPSTASQVVSSSSSSTASAVNVASSSSVLFSSATVLSSSSTGSNPPTSANAAVSTCGASVLLVAVLAMMVAALMQ